MRQIFTLELLLQIHVILLKKVAYSNIIMQYSRISSFGRGHDPYLKQNLFGTCESRMCEPQQQNRTVIISTKGLFTHQRSSIVNNDDSLTTRSLISGLVRETRTISLQQTEGHYKRKAH